MSESLAEFRPPALKTTLQAVAWFNARADSSAQRVPPRKMQMLLYIAQALYAAVNGSQALMPSVFVASSLGPQDPNLYEVMERVGDIAQPKEFEPRAEACLTLVWRRYGAMSVDELEAFVFDDGVVGTVRQAAQGGVIPLSLMAEQYRRAMIEPVMSPKPAPQPAPVAEPLEAPTADLPTMTTDGRPIRKWAPKRRVY